MRYGDAVKPPAVILGEMLARMFAKVSEGKPDERCATCAFREGQPANQTGNTLLSTLKCSEQDKPFRCHEQPTTCEGWKALYHSNDPEYQKLIGAFVKAEDQRKEWAEEGRCIQCGAAVKPGRDLCHVHVAILERIRTERVKWQAPESRR